MPNKSRFDMLPDRIIVPIEPARRRATRAQLAVSFAIAALLVAVAILISICIPGGK